MAFRHGSLIARVCRKIRRPADTRNSAPVPEPGPGSSVSGRVWNSREQNMPIMFSGLVPLVMVTGTREPTGARRCAWLQR